MKQLVLASYRLFVFGCVVSMVLLLCGCAPIVPAEGTYDFHFSNGYTRQFDLGPEGIGSAGDVIGRIGNGTYTLPNPIPWQREGILYYSAAIEPTETTCEYAWPAMWILFTSPSTLVGVAGGWSDCLPCLTGFTGELIPPNE